MNTNELKCFIKVHSDNFCFGNFFKTCTDLNSPQIPSRFADLMREMIQFLDLRLGEQQGRRAAWTSRPSALSGWPGNMHFSLP